MQNGVCTDYMGRTSWQTRLKTPYSKHQLSNMSPRCDGAGVCKGWYGWVRTGPGLPDGPTGQLEAARVAG